MTDNRVQINNLNKLIAENDAFLLTSHQDPDGDSIGSLIGFYNYLRNLGKRVEVYSQGKIPHKYRFLDPENAIKNVSGDKSPDAKIAIVLECPRYDRIGFVKELIDPRMIVINIDHHVDNEMYGQINIVDKKACAVGEILFDIFDCSGNPFGAEVANPLYAALLSDTGCFKFSNTSSRCLRVAAALVDKGARPKPIAENIFSSTTAGTLKLSGFVLQNMKLYANEKICVFRLGKGDPARFGASMENSEGLIDYTMMINGVQIGVLIKEVDSNTVKVSLRSRDGIDVCAFANSRGGGGHVNAAGFTLNESFDLAEPMIVKALSEYLHV
jgi:phosphoesterase RecJ-like protein